MSKSIAELRQSPHVSAATTGYRICVAGDLVASVQAVAEKIDDLLRDAGGKPKRAGVPTVPQDLLDEHTRLREQMLEHRGTIVFRAMAPREWRQWVAEHPARDGNTRDEIIPDFSLCNMDDLIGDLDKFAVRWNDEELSDGDFAFLTEHATDGDMYNMARTVVTLHESGVNVPKSATDWLANRENDDS